jgi:hypothetical protein
MRALSQQFANTLWLTNSNNKITFHFCTCLRYIPSLLAHITVILELTTPEAGCGQVLRANIAPAILVQKIICSPLTRLLSPIHRCCLGYHHGSTISHGNRTLIGGGFAAVINMSERQFIFTWLTSSHASTPKPGWLP